MKALFTALLTLSSSMLLHAQTSSVKTDTLSQDRYQVATNRFCSNWFISAGAGLQTYFGDHNRQMDLGDTFTLAYSAQLGKWFSPGIGVRAGATGFDIKGLTQNGSHSTGEVYDASQGLSVQKFKYHHIHGDVLFNLSNIFGGYRENRFYTFTPFVGLGWMVTEDGPKQEEVSANIGFLNAFRLSNALDLTLDIRGAMVNDSFDGELGGRRQEGSLTGLLGLSYKFKKRGWDKPVNTTTIQYDDQELNVLRNKINQLASDNDALLKQLADAKNNSITEIIVEKKVLAAPILVTFPINKSTVSNEARVNLGFFAKIIKEGNADIVYNVTGYADKGTGTAKINERLSKDRAQAIYNVLIKEFQVSPSQLNMSHEGGVANMYYNDPRLSRAVITMAQ